MVVRVRVQKEAGSDAPGSGGKTTAGSALDNYKIDVDVAELVPFERSGANVPWKLQRAG